MSKKHVSIIAVVIIAIVAAILIFLAWGNKAKAPETPSGAGSSSTAPTAAGTSTSPLSSSSSTGGITATLQHSYGNSSYSFNYPDNWSVYSYSPFIMDSFGNQYEKNGIIPPGGAEIDVVTTTAYASVGTIIQTELMSATDVATATIAVDGVQCAAVNYDNTFGNGVPSKDVAFYCEKGNKLWKMYLSFNLNDSASSTHISQFNEILGSMKFL